MADFSYDDFLSWNDPNQGDPWNSPLPADTSGWEDFTGWGDPTGVGTSGDPSMDSSLWSSLGGLASGALGGLGSLLGGGAGGPLLSALGSLGGGAIGSNAANEAAQLQSQALNRGIDLQTAQWLQQQGNLAPYLQAGQQGLSTLQGLAGREQPALPWAPSALNAGAYAVPEPTPGWSPQLYQGPQGPNAGDYRWTPGQGPQAATFRYTPGAVPTLSGQDLLANDPGVAFRLGEGRKALEASAAARGGLLSGPTLAALQRQGQELSSQEYGQAWNRASQQAQLREQWGQTASQLGWSQAQAEAAFREQMAQSASQQGWNQALQGQQNQFAQGLDTSKWNTLQQQQYAQEQYKNMLEQSRWRYGADVAQQGTDYDRQQALYRQQLAQYLLPFEQQSTLANLGGQAVGMYGTQGGQASRGISDLLAQLGSAQGTGAAGQGLAWTRALGGAANQLPSLLAGLNA